MTAVAVPQYQKAVDKSRVSTVINTVKAIKDAQEIYYLANGQYADSFDALDVELPGGELTTHTDTRRKYKDGSEYYFYVKKNYGTQSIKANPKGLKGHVAFEWYLEHHYVSDDGEPETSYVLCTGHTDRGKEICKSFGGTLAFEGYDKFFFLPF